MPETEGNDTVEDDDLELELVTSANQAGEVPDLEWEDVPLYGMKTKRGNTRVYRIWGLDVGDYRAWLGECADDPDGDNDRKLVAWCARDRQNKRIWPRTDKAEAEMKTWPRQYLSLLVAACNRTNHELTEGMRRAEKNSRKTPSSRRPTTSPGTSDSST